MRTDNVPWGNIPGFQRYWWTRKREMKKDERQGYRWRKLRVRCKANPKAKCFLRETIVAKIRRPTGCQAWRASQTIGRWTTNRSSSVTPQRWDVQISLADICLSGIWASSPLSYFELVGICRGYFSLCKFWGTAVPEIFFDFTFASNFISKYIYIYRPRFR